MLVLKPTVAKLDCPKCGASMKLVPINPANPQKVWVCTTNDRHRVIPGREQVKP